MQIYTKIKKICKEKKLSIAYVEAKAGISNGAIGKWKKSSPNSQNLKAVADVLGVTVDELLKE